MQKIGRNYPKCGYGERFYSQVFSDNPLPYNSSGNGSAMRVSAPGFAAKNPEEAKFLSRKITEAAHNHPEGLKGAEAAAVSVYMAESRESMQIIWDYIHKNYYPLDFSLDEIRDNYEYDATCQGSRWKLFLNQQILKM